MISEDYYNRQHDSYEDLTSFEEELLMNYDEYLEHSSSYSLKAENHYDLELDDLDTEYDENDWEEEEENEEENAEEEIREPGTFLM